MSLKSQLIQLTNEFGLVFARFGTAEYCEATLMVFRLGTKVDKDPGAPSLPSVQTATLLNACITHVDLGRMSRFSPWSRPYGPAFDYWVPINKQANSYTLWMSLSSKWQLSQQRYAVARDTIPRRKSVTEAAIQLLSAVLGSVAAVAAAVFGLEDAVTVVLVVMFVLGDVAAGFTAGSVVGPTPGCPAAGPAPPAVSPAPPPGTSRPSVSPVGGVATSAQPPHARPRPRRHPPRHQHQRPRQWASQIARTQATRLSTRRRHRLRPHQATMRRRKATTGRTIA